MHHTTHHLEAVIAHSTRAIGHYTRLLAGDGLTAADKRQAHLGIIRAAMSRAWAYRELERKGVNAEREMVTG